MSLSDAQLAILKTAIAANVDATFVVARQTGATGAMADWYNRLTAPAYICWKTSVPIAQVGIAINSGELAGLTTANTSRLQVMAMFSGGSFDPSQPDVQAGFNTVFSGAGGTLTRAALLVLWKRTAKNGERVFASGLGTDAAPSAFTFEGNITNEDIVRALQ